MEGIIINNLDYPVLTVCTFLPLAGALIMLFLKRGPFIKWFADDNSCNIYHFAAYLQTF